MNGTHQERIRERAHQIWEDEGRPDGKHEEHWRQAVDELGREEGDGSNPEAGAAGISGEASSLQPGGTEPSSSQSTLGSMGTGGGSTAGTPTGNARKR